MNDGVPNNAAAALFSTKLRGYTQMQLRLARFRGINKIEFIDNQGWKEISSNCLMPVWLSS